MTSAWLAERELADVALSIVTPESRPLQLFGREASDAVERLLERRGIAFHPGACATQARDGELLLVGGDIVVADRVVALPRLEGPRIAGIPQTVDGFIPVDGHGRVTGIDDVYAAGDVTTFAVKQGGIAAQQAEAAAEAIAADAGAPVDPRPYRRILRGVVLTGEEPLFLRRDLDDEHALARPLRGAPPGVSRVQLWWPSGKIAGRYLTGFLAAGGTPGERLTDRPKRLPLPN
jgi:sulfide:quinone oxidoreductase